MDAHCEMIMNEYREKLPVYQKLQIVIDDILKQLAKTASLVPDSLGSRIKTGKSLAGKLELKGNKYKSLLDLTDIVGARIVTFYSDDVDKFAAIIEKMLDVDWDNSIDKRKMHSIDSFGYMSLHYICRIPKEMFFDENMPEINEIRFEIQIRTALQHCWASVNHDIGYKNNVEVPKEYLRRINRLAGILELADSEFNDIKKCIDDYRRRVEAVIKTGKFEDIELNIDSFKAYLNVGPFDGLNERISEINNMEIQQVSLITFLSVFKSFGFQSLDQVHSLITKYSEDAYQYAVRQFSGTDLDIMSSFLGPQLLCVVYLLRNGGGEQQVEGMLDILYGHSGMNHRQAKRLVDLGRKMGM